MRCTCAAALLLLLAVATAAIVTPAPDLETAVADFNAWVDREFARAGGAEVANLRRVRAAVLPAPRRIGLVATQAITEDDVYVSLPASLAIDAETTIGAAQPFLRYLKPPLDERQAANLGFFGDRGGSSASATGEWYEEILIGARLLYEYAVLGDRSEFAPYLRLLPLPHNTNITKNNANLLPWSSPPLSPSSVGSLRGVPIFFSDAQLRALRGTRVDDKVRQLRRRYDEMFDFLQSAFLKPMRAVQPNIFPVSANGDDTFSRALWRWAMGIFTTRAVWWGGRPHLAPLLDCANHARSALRPHRTTLDAASAATRTRAVASFAAGDEVTEEYHETTPFLFLFHGFVANSSRPDCAQVVLPSPAGASGGGGGLSPKAEEVKRLVSGLLQQAQLLRTYCVGVVDRQNRAVLADLSPQQMQQLHDEQQEVVIVGVNLLLHYARGVVVARDGTSQQLREAFVAASGSINADLAAPNGGKFGGNADAAFAAANVYPLLHEHLRVIVEKSSSDPEAVRAMVPPWLEARALRYARDILLTQLATFSPELDPTHAMDEKRVDAEEVVDDPEAAAVADVSRRFLLRQRELLQSALAEIGRRMQHVQQRRQKQREEARSADEL